MPVLLHVSIRPGNHLPADFPGLLFSLTMRMWVYNLQGHGLVQIMQAQGNITETADGFESGQNHDRSDLLWRVRVCTKTMFGLRTISTC